MTFSDAPFVLGGEREDLLGRLPYVRALLTALRSNGLDTPLVVGVYGGWGTGKTSVMKTLRDALEKDGRLTLWFDAWVYARQEQVLWRALLLRVVTALGEHLESGRSGLKATEKEGARAKLDEARERLYRSMTVTTKDGMRVNWWGALPLAADAALTALTAGLNKEVAKAVSGNEQASGVVAALSKWFKGSDTKEIVRLIEREASERYVEQVTSLEQFQELLRDLLDLFGIGKDRHLTVFVDDLDRCLPEDAVAALEAIKLFLDLRGCVFILGMDREVVEQGIRIRYREVGEVAFNARDYLDKIIQVPFNLPPLGAEQIRAYLAGLRGPAADAFSACSDLFERAAPANPRTLKRALNALLLTLYLDGFDASAFVRLRDDAAARDRVRRLAKLVLLQLCFPEAWAAMRAGRCTLNEAEKLGRGEQVAPSVTNETRQMFAGKPIQSLFRLDPPFSALPEAEREALITLSRTVQGSPAAPGGG